MTNKTNCDSKGQRTLADKADGLMPDGSQTESRAEGWSRFAAKAIPLVPDALPTNRDELGLVGTAKQAKSSVPRSSRTPRSAKGLNRSAAKAVKPVPDALPPNDGKDLDSSADKARSALSGPSPIAETGRLLCADRAASPMPLSAPQSRAGHIKRAAKAGGALPVSAPPIDGDEAGLAPTAGQARVAVPASSPIGQLAELQVRRKFYIGAVNKQTNAVKALVRRGLGWRYDTEEVDRNKVNGRAARIVAAALNGREQKAEDVEVYRAIAADLAVVAAAIEPMQNARNDVEKQMKRLARTLPIYPWAKSVTGLGELGLSVIVAEVGDLAGYPKKGHLWKRLGLAPHNGKAYSTWRTKGGLTAEDWTAAGYSPRRRAEVFAVISEPLFRAQSVSKGPYRAIYDRRREATSVTHDDWTKAHSHMDALRVMTKYLIRDLWVAWRRAVDQMPETARPPVPVAEPIDEREAEIRVPASRARVRLPSAHHPDA